MINPNKSYKSKVLTKIIYIDSHDAYIPYLRIETLGDDPQIFEGNLKQCNKFWYLLKDGDVVDFIVQYSITREKFMINSIIRKRVA